MGAQTADDRLRRGGRVALAALALAAGAAYLTWRAGWTLGGSWWLSLPLLGVEIVLFVRFALFVVMSLPDPGETTTRSAGSTGEPLAVELLVPAAHADRDDLSRTLVLACGVGAAVVRVLDRTDRAEMRREAERLGAVYEVHEVADHLGSAALVESARSGASTQLLAWVDAGDVVLPGFLDLASTLLDTDAARVAVVQSSTDLINSDSLLHLRPDRDELAVENRVTGPSLGGSGSAPWNGSGSIFRGDALDAVGGLPARAASTHRAASRLARAGWQVRWSVPPAVRSVAPDLLGEHLATVGHQAHVRFVALFGGDSPLRARRGVPLRRRASQIHASTAVLDGAARLTLLGLVTATLLTGHLPFQAPLGVLVAAFAVQAALRTLALVRLGRGAIGVGDATRQGLRRMGVHVVGLFRAPRTPSVDSRGGVGALGRLRLLTAALVVVDAALVLRGLTFVVPGLLPRFEGGGRFVVMAAAVWLVVGMVDVLQLLVGRVQRRASHRNVTDLVARVDEKPCKVVDLTPRGIGLMLAAPPAVGDSLSVELDIPRLDGSTTALEVAAHLRHISAQPDPDRGRYRAGASFEDLDDDARDALVEFCALTADQRDPARSAPLTTAPEELVVAGSGFGRRVFAALSAVAVLFSGLVVAAGPASAESMDPGMGSIAGRVLRVDGQPADGMCVQTNSGPGWAASTTDATGAFSLDGLTPGSYTVVAGNCMIPGVVATYSGSTIWPSQAVAYDVTAGQTVASGDLTLQPAGFLQGSTVDAGGNPADGICVSFVAVQPDQGEQWFWAGNSDMSGQFNGTVPAGVDGRVQFRDCGWPQRFVDAWYGLPGGPPAGTTLNVGAGATVMLDPVTMQAGIVVTGRVTDDGGAPVQDVCVNIQVPTQGQWEWIAGANTDVDGNYSVMVPAGTYVLGFWPCGNNPSGFISQWYPATPTSTYPPPTVEVSASAHVFDAVLQRGGRIAGTALDSQGAPAVGVCVMAGTPSAMRDGKSASWTQVGADGTWLSDPMPPGDYAIYYRDCSPEPTWIDELRPDIHPDFGDRYTDADLDLIEVVAGQTTSGITDTLQHAARLVGTVTSGGQPAGGVCVGGVRGGGDQFVTQADGSWSAKALPGVPVAVTFTDCVAGRGLVQQSRTVHPIESQELRVDVDLTTAGTTSISGSVLNAAGVAPSAPTCVVPYVPNNLIAMTAVGADGHFEVAGLADGDYWVAVIGCGSEDDMGIHFPGDPTSYEPIWSSGQPLGSVERSSPDPAGDGVPVVAVRAAQPPAAMAICVGPGCPPPSPPAGQTTTTVPVTTLPQTTIPPTTDAALPTAPPATAPPATAPLPTVPPAAAPPTTVSPVPDPGDWFAAAGLRLTAAQLGGRRGSSDPARALFVAWTMGRSEALARAAATAAVQGVEELAKRQRALVAATAATTTTSTAAPASTAMRSQAPLVANIAVPTVTTEPARGDIAAAPLSTESTRNGPPWDLIGGAALLLGAAAAVAWMRRTRSR